MALPPTARLEPFTVRLAVPGVPARGAVPSVVLPFVNVTVPAGVELPDAGFTVAVRMVESVGRRPAGPAASVVAVATGGAVTFTVTEPADAAKFPLVP